LYKFIYFFCFRFNFLYKEIPEIKTIDEVLDKIEEDIDSFLEKLSEDKRNI
jgi:hypothetical protein